LFETRDNERPWTLLEVLSHAESRSKARELVSDHLGQRSSQGAAVHHNALAPASSPKDTEKAHFGHMLAAMLDQGLRSQRFDQWVLVSPPHFLGMLRNLLTPELQKHLSASVAKDLTHIDAADLHARLQDIFDNLPDEPTGVRSARKHAN
jgi:protein required for attachment to host cells